MKAAKRKARNEGEDATTIGSAFTAMRNDIQNLDKTFQGMAKSMDDRAKVREIRAKAIEISALKKEQIELSKELYVTCKDGPEAYKKVIRDRLDEIEQLLDD